MLVEAGIAVLLANGRHLAGGFLNGVGKLESDSLGAKYGLLLLLLLLGCMYLLQGRRDRVVEIALGLIGSYRYEGLESEVGTCSSTYHL
jgi:hypothetical protein